MPTFTLGSVSGRRRRRCRTEPPGRCRSAGSSAASLDCASRRVARRRGSRSPAMLAATGATRAGRAHGRVAARAAAGRVSAASTPIDQASGCAAGRRGSPSTQRRRAAPSAPPCPASSSCRDVPLGLGHGATGRGPGRPGPPRSVMPGEVSQVDQHVPAPARSGRPPRPARAARPPAAVLAGDVEQPGRQLPQDHADRVAVLVGPAAPGPASSSARIADRAGVHDDVARRRPAPACTSSVAPSMTRPDVPDRAVTDGSVSRTGRVSTGSSRLDRRPVAASAGAGPRRRSVDVRVDVDRPALPRGRRQRPRRTPANSGCARVGRDRNSGCAWVRDEERVHVARQLDELDQPAVRRRAGEDQAGLLEPLAVGVVDLVAVPVPLADLRPRRTPRATSEPSASVAGYEPEPHRAAHVAARRRRRRSGRPSSR